MNSPLLNKFPNKEIFDIWSLLTRNQNHSHVVCQVQDGLYSVHSTNRSKPSYILSNPNVPPQIATKENEYQAFAQHFPSAFLRSIFTGIYTES